MDTIPAALSDAYRLLLMELYVHLDIAEFHAMKGADWDDTDIDTARDLIPDLVLVIRKTLTAHESDARGRCATCPTAWPCPVINQLHGLIKAPDLHMHKMVRVDRDS